MIKRTVIGCEFRVECQCTVKVGRPLVNDIVTCNRGSDPACASGRYRSVRAGDFKGSLRDTYQTRVRLEDAVSGGLA